MTSTIRTSKPKFLLFDNIFELSPSFFIHSLIYIQQQNHFLQKSIKLTLVYIFNKNHKILIQEIMNYLTPYCKFFYDTQMNGIELKKYEQTISFILDLIIECYEENRTYFNEVNSEVLIFCLIYSESKEKTKKPHIYSGVPPINQRSLESEVVPVLPKHSTLLIL